MKTEKPHTVATDPGIAWVKDEAPAIDAPPDNDTAPAPEARWPSDAGRTGLCGAVSPNVVPLPGGGCRMYYTQMTPRPGHPAGANDYDNCTARILSALSADGATWTPEPGVRLSPNDGGAGEFRVVSPEVVPVPGGGGRLRMYFECCPGTQEEGSTIRSAVSDDGLDWQVEPGERLASGQLQLPPAASSQRRHLPALLQRPQRRHRQRALRRRRPHLPHGAGQADRAGAAV